MKARILIWILMFRFRPSFYPEGSAPRGKNNNADAVVEWNNGKQWVVDFKCMLGNGTKIRERLNDAYMQADYAIIKIKGKVKDMEQVTNEIDAFLKSRQLFKGVVVYDHRNNVIYKTI